VHARRCGEVKILLDECVDRRLARDLAEHSVSTVPRRGWAGIKNGELLALAENEFDLFITVDRKISTQQDLTKFKIPVLLIRARTNRLEDIRPLVPELLKTLTGVRAGTLTTIGE
jgi:predicted nuclease of predicted toxin-antitoxin system